VPVPRQNDAQLWLLVENPGKLVIDHYNDDDRGRIFIILAFIAAVFTFNFSQKTKLKKS
jgi:hypothetical protein